MKMLLHQRANHADQRKSIRVSRPLSTKRQKFTFVQSKRFPPNHNLPDEENNYFGMRTNIR